MRRLIFLLIFLIIFPSVSASVFDWITGRTVEETMIKEQVKCVFLNSFNQQTCYSDDGRYKCSGDGACVIEVSDANGKTIRWKSSCGGESITTVDGNDKSVEFKCEQPTAVQPVVETSVKEQVKCVFANSDNAQKCYTEDGRFGCSGIGSCIADVSGEKEAKLLWKTSCIETVSIVTVIDGVNENIGFACQQTAPATPEVIKEQVKCLFTNSNSEQKCYTESFACGGTGTCIAEVSGEKGKMLTWKSTCGGYAYTVIDGNNDYAEFKCEQSVPIQQPIRPITEQPVQQPITEQPVQPSVMIKEIVKLHYFYWRENCPDCESEKLFLEQLKQKYPTVEYESYDANPSSGMVYNLIVLTYLKTGLPTIFLADKVWTGYSDSINQEIEDKIKNCIQSGCSEVPSLPSIESKIGIPAAQPVTQENASAPPKIIFFYKNDCSYCKSEMAFLEDLLKKIPQLKLQSIEVSDSSMSYIKEVLKPFNAEPNGYPTTVVYDTLWFGFNDEIAREIQANILSFFLSAPIKASKLPEYPAGQAAKEQIECIFWNSDVLVNPHTARPEKCYSDDSRFGCTWTGNVVEKESDGNKVRYPYCIADVSGVRGSKLTWKSTCGGYAYTVIDGNNEAAEFKCVPSSEVIEEQIIGKGFRYLYFQCYDGKEEKQGSETSCKSSEIWQRYAKEACKDHCYADKCGVNTFSVSEDCYIDVGKESIVFPEKPKKEEAIPLMCKDSCPLNEKCYPFGYRKEGKFCSDGGNFIPQLEADQQCDNNFECGSNVCIDGKCVSSGFIKKIMDWFKKWFD